MPAAMSHSHRATTKIINKAFKSRKATKGSLRDQAKGKQAILSPMSHTEDIHSVLYFKAVSLRRSSLTLRFLTESPVS